MKRTIPLLVSITLLASCTVQQQKSTVDLLPQPAQYDSNALDQKEPTARYADFDHQYREGTYQAPYWPLEANYEGIGQLIMPPSVRPEAAWAYISGERFHDERRPGWCSAFILGSFGTRQPNHR